MGKGLQAGDTIGIIAPSAPAVPDCLSQAVALFRHLEYHVKLGRSVTADWGYLAGSDQVRADDVNHFFADPSIDAIVCLRGGYGATRLLDLLDYETIKANPKLFIGFSDITALHTVLRQRCGLATIHAPMATSLGRRPTAYTRQQFIQGLAQPVTAGPFPLPRRRQLECLVPGKVSGIIEGGNMCLLTSLLGTPYELVGKDAILVLEEIGEEAYSLDRMLRQLEQNRLIERIRGIVFGDFAKCRPVKPQAGEFTVEEILTYYAKRWQKPAIKGLPIGHGRQNGWLPLGVKGTIKAEENGPVEFILA